MIVLVAHGTRRAAGVRTIDQLAEAISARVGTIRTAFVDVVGPHPAEVLSGVDGPAIVVPAFLASGYHVHTDLPARVAQSGHPDVTVARALGPDRVLAAVMHDRLREAGWRCGDAVVMTAAGSSDPRACRELRLAAAYLAERIGPVELGFVATGMPRANEVVTRLHSRRRRRVFIAPYLLAPGLFHDRLQDCEATAVADPIGAHPAIVDLLVSRLERSERVADVA
ncbi:MAG TPA: CbiX/SirB N-terminal domain-containing protein [Mycobacterium sp.]|nr:CbiX/SirB N-terminal domain-containing protein [Mycobacterium sp.]